MRVACSTDETSSSRRVAAGEGLQVSAEHDNPQRAACSLVVEVLSDRMICTGSCAYSKTSVAQPPGTCMKP